MNYTRVSCRMNIYEEGRKRMLEIFEKRKEKKKIHENGDTRERIL